MSGQIHVPAAAPPVKEPQVPIIGGWVGPGTGVDAAE
jgi:hypothetical protein